MKINIGIDEDQRKAIAHGLSILLADTYTLYLKTHNYHWNVTGPKFFMIHKMTEEQYGELFKAIDDIAERVRQLRWQREHGLVAGEIDRRLAPVMIDRDLDADDLAGVGHHQFQADERGVGRGRGRKHRDVCRRDRCGRGGEGPDIVARARERTLVAGQRIAGDIHVCPGGVSGELF